MCCLIQYTEAACWERYETNCYDYVFDWTFGVFEIKTK